MKIDGDTVTFDTGKKVDVNCGIVGLSPDLSVYAGYDNSWFIPDPYYWDDEDKADPQSNHYLTPSERIELADHMIEQWTRFKVAALNVPPGHDL